MGLIDMVSSFLGSKGAGGQEQNVITAVTDFVNQQPGGLEGLVQQFHQQGAGEMIQSWIGNGANQTATADLIQKVAGSSGLSELAGKLGVSPEQASSVLTQVLPLVVNHATPGGQLPQGGQLDAGSVATSIQNAGGLASLAEGFLGKKES
jgi:uncharacterized protein YidB (DUF937 family)